jgi:Arc/MetJ family transcription regulator
MRKRTTINLDVDLVRAAQEALGTTETTETVHRALAEVVNRRKRQIVLAYDFPGLTPEMLEEMRRNPVLSEDLVPRT